MRRPRRGRDLERSLTLLRVFLLASALICTGAGVALGSILSHSLKTEALDAEKTALARYVDGVVHPLLVHDDQVEVPWRKDAQLAQSVLRQHDIATVKVWTGSGVLAWTSAVSRASTGGLVANRDRRLVDHRFPLDEALSAAIAQNQPIADLVGTGGDGEDAFERNKLGYAHLFEVYSRRARSRPSRASTRRSTRRTRTRRGTPSAYSESRSRSARSSGSTGSASTHSASPGSSTTSARSASRTRSSRSRIG